MADPLFLILLPGSAGLVLGAWMQRQTRARRRRARLTGIGLLLLPAMALMLAGVLGSNTLGWLAGLGMIAVLGAGVPFLAGWFLGFLMARVLRGPATGAAPAPAPDAVAAPSSKAVTGQARPPKAVPVPMVTEAALPSSEQPCCKHLQALDCELIRAGLAVRHLDGRNAQVGAVLGVSALAPLPDGVQPEEPVRPDERGAPEQLARLYCTRCDASLWFVHSQRALVTTPRYPP